MQTSLCLPIGYLGERWNQPLRVPRENQLAIRVSDFRGFDRGNHPCWLEIRGVTPARERVFQRYGLTGATGEAASGHATVRTTALPVYDRLRLDGVGEDVVLLQVLLHLLAVNDDTNLLSRGGPAGLDYVCAHARKLLWEGGALTPDGVKKMAAFDDTLIARNLSPGGTAVLLGLTWFLAQFPTLDGDLHRASDRIGQMFQHGEEATHA